MLPICGGYTSVTGGGCDRSKNDGINNIGAGGAGLVDRTALDGMFNTRS